MLDAVSMTVFELPVKSFLSIGSIFFLFVRLPFPLPALRLDRVCVCHLELLVFGF